MIIIKTYFFIVSILLEDSGTWIKRKPAFILQFPLFIKYKNPQLDAVLQNG
jgi:hypothetical protein